MACWKSLVLAVAILGSISVAKAQLTAEFLCRPADATVPGEAGSFFVTITSAGDVPLVLSNYKQVASADSVTYVPCLDGTLTRGGTEAAPTDTYTLAVSVPSDAANLPCGVVAVGTDGAYQLNFATASVEGEDGVAGYVPLKDIRFTADCPSFTEIQVTLTAAGFPVVSTLSNVAAVNTLPPGFSLTITTATLDAPNTFVPVPADDGIPIPIDNTLRIEVVLDTAVSAPVTKFRVTNLRFTQTGTLTTTAADGAPTARSAVIAKLNGDAAPSVCPTAAGASMSMPVSSGVFDYVTSGTTVTATSQIFAVLTLFQPGEVTGSTLPPMILTASIVACGAGDSCDAIETCTTIAARKRRDAGEELETGENVDKGELYGTVLVSVDPRAIAYGQQRAAAALSNSNTVCEPMTSNMGYLIGMIVLAALLVFSVAVTVFMFSRMSRPRTEYPKA